MATASITGRIGKLKFSTNLSALSSALTAVAELNDVTLTLNRKTIDVTSHDSSGFQENLAGIGDWKVTGKVNYISTGAGQSKAAQQLVSAAPLKMRVSVQATTAIAAKLYIGNAQVTRFEMGHPTDKQAIATVELVGTGPLSRTS